MDIAPVNAVQQFFNSNRGHLSSLINAEVVSPRNPVLEHAKVTEPFVVLLNSRTAPTPTPPIERTPTGSESVSKNAEPGNQENSSEKIQQNLQNANPSIKTPLPVEVNYDIETNLIMVGESGTNLDVYA